MRYPNHHYYDYHTPIDVAVVVVVVTVVVAVVAEFIGLVLGLGSHC